MTWSVNFKAWLLQHPLVFHLLLLLFIVLVAHVAHVATMIISRYLFVKSVRKQRPWLQSYVKFCYFLFLPLRFYKHWGVPLVAIYTAAGGEGIGITLAAQDMLKNIFGGLMLYFDRPFNIGNWISSPDKKIEGTVEKIGWRTTRIRTFDKRPLYVPNSTFLAVSVENPSRMLHRRIRTDIGVRYCEFQQIPRITQAIEEMLRNDPDIATEQTIWVNLVNFANSALEFRVYAFTKITEWVPFQKIQQAVFLKILDIIEKNGAEAAFPLRTLYVPDDITIKPLDKEKYDALTGKN